MTMVLQYKTERVLYGVYCYCGVCTKNCTGDREYCMAENEFSELIQVRVSPVMKKRIYEWARRAGMNPSSYVRYAMLEGATETAKRLMVFRSDDLLKENEVLEK